MMQPLTPIGFLRTVREEYVVDILPEYRPGLEGLDGFGHVLVVFGFHQAPPFLESDVMCESPYRGGPGSLGVFATRSPVRPNPMGITACSISKVDLSNGRVTVGYHDAHEGTPVWDLKPYTPSIDRIDSPLTPAWADAWPASVEESGTFDWSTVF